MSLRFEGFLEFAKPRPDKLPSFAELVHDRVGFTEEPSWLPQAFLYMGKDEWGRDEIKGISSTDFVAKPGHQLAWKVADLENKNPVHIEYAAPHYQSWDVISLSPLKATQMLHVCKDEWEHAYVFHVISDRYRPAQHRQQMHFVKFGGNVQTGEPFISSYRVVIKNQLSLDYVSAVPDVLTGDCQCAAEFIRYLQGYYKGR